MTIPMVTFVGRSNSGKTTLLVKLIAELRRRGYRVATIKHHSHSEFDIDHPGKDSWRHAQAGSEHVMVVSPHKMASYRYYDREPHLEELVNGISGVDILLIEGYKKAKLPTFEIVRAANSLDLVGRPECRFAIATDAPLDLGVPKFGLDDIEAIADFIVERFLQGHTSNGTDSGRSMISYEEAYRLTIDHIAPLGNEILDIAQCCWRPTAEDLVARVDSPSLDASLKDGYAVRSRDIAAASSRNPVRLQIIGTAAAGRAWQGELRPHTAVSVLTGAPVPCGADAVVSSEFTTEEEQSIVVTNTSEPGRNILKQGSDTAQGRRIVTRGTLLRPATIGLLAAAGHDQLPVVRRPRVAILATGDEVVAPGKPLEPGKLYASNLTTLAAWCHGFGMPVSSEVAPDDPESIRQKLLALIEGHDALLTSGGAWSGERDLTVRILDELGWQKIYHRVRIGPGKAVGFGLFRGKPVFCLPGGPPSNHMAFLQFALPGLHRLENRDSLGLPWQFARLSAPVTGLTGWTQFVHGELRYREETLEFHPLRLQSRLQEMAEANALLMIPEGIEAFPAGAFVRVQLLAEVPGAR